MKHANEHMEASDGALTFNPLWTVSRRTQNIELVYSYGQVYYSNEVGSNYCFYFDITVYINLKNIVSFSGLLTFRIYLL